ncbi:D-3-phosphoglycerate dehydrogenase 2, partial [Coemansia sp. RSA 1285]
MVDTLKIESNPISRRDSFNIRDTHTRNLKPFNSGDIKILLLENISQKAVDILKKAGYQVEHHAKALDKETLIEKIKDVHAVGISNSRSVAELVIAEIILLSRQLGDRSREMHDGVWNK